MNENKPRRRAQAQAAQKKARKSGLSRFVLMVTMMALVAVVSIGGTMAWLQDNTEEVVNTFTTSDIDIELTETDSEDTDTDSLKNEYQMIPGKVIDKDPTITVSTDSEDLWLFVELTKVQPTYKDDASNEVKAKTFDDFLTYSMAEGWEKVDETLYPGVYYRKVAKTDTDREFSVLDGDKVTVNTDVTKAMMNGIATNPQLKVKAYAVQTANLTDTKGAISGDDAAAAARAWALAKPANSSEGTNP